VLVCSASWRGIGVVCGGEPFAQDQIGPVDRRTLGGAVLPAGDSASDPYSVRTGLDTHGSRSRFVRREDRAGEAGCAFRAFEPPDSRSRNPRVAIHDP
jgi:hypothetical protein